MRKSLSSIDYKDSSFHRVGNESTDLIRVEIRTVNVFEFTKCLQDMIIMLMHSFSTEKSHLFFTAERKKFTEPKPLKSSWKFVSLRILFSPKISASRRVSNTFILWGVPATRHKPFLGAAKTWNNELNIGCRRPHLVLELQLVWKNVSCQTKNKISNNFRFHSNEIQILRAENFVHFIYILAKHERCSVIFGKDFVHLQFKREMLSIKTGRMCFTFLWS